MNKLSLCKLPSLYWFQHLEATSPISPTKAHSDTLTLTLLLWHPSRRCLVGFPGWTSHHLSPLLFTPHIPFTKGQQQTQMFAEEAQIHVWKTQGLILKIISAKGQMTEISQLITKTVCNVSSSLQVAKLGLHRNVETSSEQRCECRKKKRISESEE